MSKGQRVLWLLAVIGIVALASKGWLICLVVIVLGLIAVFFDEICEAVEAVWNRIF